MKVDIKVVAGTISIEDIPEGGFNHKLPEGFEYMVLVENGGAFGVSASDKERMLTVDEKGNVTVEDAGVIISG